MSFEIRNIKTRDGDEIINIRGCDDGTVEFVRFGIVKEKVDGIETGKEIETVTAYKFYNNLESALDKLFRMRCCNRDASTLQELLANVKEERTELVREFQSGLITRRPRR